MLLYLVSCFLRIVVWKNVSNNHIEEERYTKELIKGPNKNCVLKNSASIMGSLCKKTNEGTN